MTVRSDYQICVLPGDGIGPEVIAPTCEILSRAVARAGGRPLAFTEQRAGAFVFRDEGNALPASTLKAARAADATLLGAMGWPTIRYANGTEITPQIDLRTELGLYAGVRPVRVLPGMPKVLADQREASIDFVLVRESVEGLFARRHEGVVEADEARETLVITRPVSERLFDFSFRLAERRKQRGAKGVVTCVDKANVFRSFAFFREIFDERAKSFPGITADHAYVDAIALFMVRRPWTFDVLVTENMFGDILSDLGAGLMGGMGFAPSADIGDEHAVFQPCHGSAPDIAGQGKANPVATILSGAMLLEWLGETHGDGRAVLAAEMVRAATDAALAGGIRPYETGGDAGTRQIVQAVLEHLPNVQVAA